MLTNTQISNILNALGTPNGVWKDGSWYSFEGASTTNTQAVNYVDILTAIEAPNAFWINGVWSEFTDGTPNTTVLPVSSVKSVIPSIPTPTTPISAVNSGVGDLA